MSSYERLPDSTSEEHDGDQYRSTISPYESMDVKDMGSTQEELEMGLSKVEGIQDAPEKKSREKYSSDEKRFDYPHLDRPSKKESLRVAEPKAREDSIRDQLYNAALRGKMDVVKRILAEHFVTLMPDENGQTPLFAACMGRQRQVMEYLILYGYDVNHQDNEGKTVLHIAFEYEHPDFARILINQFSASYKIRDNRGWTALHSAVDSGYFTVASRLMQEFLETDTGMEVSWIQLQAACHEQKLQYVQFLLDTKADVNHRSSSGYTSLHIATRANCVPIMRCLIEHGADPNVICAKKKAACHKAVTSGNYQTLECLLTCPNIDLNIADGEGDTPLHLAMKTTSDIIQLLLRHDMDVNRVNFRCLTPLHMAVAKRRMDVVRGLLMKGARIDILDPDGHSPLHVAVIQRDRALVDLLCQYQSEVDARSKDGATALHIAVNKAEEEIIQKLLDKGANPNVPDCEGDSCLQVAIHFCKESIIAMLLAAGAVVNGMDRTGETPLHLAIHKGISSHILQAMINYSAEIDALNKKHQTPLMVALARMVLDPVEVLVNAGASVDIPDHNGNTALHMAMHKGFTPAVPHLLTRNPNLNLQNSSNETPLFLACVKRNTEQVKLLLEAGAQPDVVSKEEITCLQVACSINHPELVRLLLPHSDVNKINLRQHTALVLGCLNKNATIVRSLLEAGANPNLADKVGDTCLHMTVMRQLPELVQLLVEHGADVNAKNHQDQTALHLACAKEDSAVAKLLMEHGANVNAQDNKRNTPLHRAIVSNALGIVHELFRHGADVNLPGQQSWTPLHTAVLQGTDAVTAAIFAQQPHTDCQDEDGDTPLHIACRETSLQKTIWLLSYGADTRIKNYSRRVPLYYAVKNSSKDILEAFVQRAKPVSLNTLVESCEPALHYYCRRGKAAMVEWLIEHGAEKDKICVRGSALDAALDSNNKDIVYLLINAGATVSGSATASGIGFLERVYRQRDQHLDVLKYMIECEKCALDLTDVNEEGETLFFQACRDQAVDVIQLLLPCPKELGVNVCNKYGKSAVSIVCELAAVPLCHDAVKILDMVVKSNRSVDLVAPDYQGMTPLHIVCQNASLSMAKILLQKCEASSVNTCNAKERTPLHLAATADLVDLLVGFGAEVNKRDYLGQTPLLFSCQQRHEEVASKLLALQTDAVLTRDEMRRSVTHHCTFTRMLHILDSISDLPINDLDINKQSPLHIAVMNDDTKSVQKLLERGANVNIVDKCKLSPLHYAKSSTVSNLLKQHGADTTARSERGCTPEDMVQWYEKLREAETTDLYGSLSRERHDYLQKIIDMPLVGFIENHKEQEKEYREIKTLLKQFIHQLAQQVQRVDNELEIELMPSGSMNEGTKVCMPDEGDCIFILTKFSEMIQPPIKFSFQTANVTLNLKDEYMATKPDFVDKDGRVMTELLFYRFYNAVQQALAVPDLWTQFPQLYRLESDDITKLSRKISPMSLKYHGRVFRWMPISVDVVPGFQFRLPGGGCWQPSWCKDRAVLRDTECSVVAKDIDHAPEDLRPYLFQLGFTNADAAMFQRMAPELKDGYKLAKIMRQPMICKPLKNSKNEELRPASSFISSYMLKTIAFHIHEESLKSPEKFRMDKTPVQCAHRIYSKLLEALKKDFLEMYPIEGHDILRNHYKPSEGNASAYKTAKKYCDQICNLLSPGATA